MPQINRIRVNNVKYNFGTQVYDDFVMRFNCQNTIYDLANGGGKSLLMLLLMQNMLPNCTLDDKQPIEKLFRQGSGNTCIHSLVEWKLDPCYQKDGFRFMTTGFCARKGRGTDDENQDGQEQTAAPTASVEYFNYCIFYREFGDNDIKNLPLVSNGERITYNGLKAYLRDLEKGGYKYVVKIFDRKGDYQSFISNYGIYESAWEIVRGINKTEGHVRTYFESNYKTSRKVVEDLLIEEIIQKSFNNKLSVDNDEGMMAQTLMDIKDKLVELSKKHSQLGAYDSQIAAIDSFKEYLSTYEAFYNRKEEIEKQLYDLLLVAMRESDKKDKELRSQDDLITKMYDELAHEKEAIAVAEVMSEKNSMAGVESLVNETRKALELKNAAIEEARGKLSLMESAGDYKDYAEYEKSYKGLQIAIDNRLREDTDITAELKILAAGYRKFYETETRRLKEKLDIAANRVKALEVRLSESKDNLRNADKEAAGLGSLSDNLENEIQELQAQLGVALSEAGTVVCENASEEYDKSFRDKELLKNEETRMSEKFNDVQQQLMSLNETISANKALIDIFTEQSEKLEKADEAGNADAERMGKIREIYSADNDEAKLSVILETYQKMRSEYTEECKAAQELENFIDNARKGTYICKSPERDRLKEYLESQYGSDVVEGHEWFAALNAGQKRDVLKRTPFIEYAFIIKNDFERIKADEMLKDFGKGAVAYPVISEQVLIDTKLEINKDLIVFALKDMSFLRDEAKLETQIKLAQEELESHKAQAGKLADRMELVWNDYTFALVYNAASGKVDASEAEAIRLKIADSEAAIIEAEKKRSVLNEVKEQLSRNLAQTRDDIEEKETTCSLLSRIMEMNTSIDKKYERLKGLKADVDSARNRIYECEEAAASANSEYDTARDFEDSTRKAYDEIIKSWEEQYAPYYDENVSIEIDDDTYRLDKDEIESRFTGLKTALSQKNSDFADKQALMSHLSASMNKCRDAIEYRGYTFDDIKAKYEAGEIMAAGSQQLRNAKDALNNLVKGSDSVREELESQEALLNRLEGSIAHGINQIENNYGSFNEFPCDDPDGFITQHKALIKKLEDNTKTQEKTRRQMSDSFKDILVCRKDLERIVSDAGMHVPEEFRPEDAQGITANLTEYEAVHKEYASITRLEYKKVDEFNKNKSKLIDLLNGFNAVELADEVRISLNVPENVAKTRSMIESLNETNTFIQLEKDRIAKGIEDMQMIKDNFENRCIQTCSNIKTELDRLPQLSNINLDGEQIAIISLQIPYIKEELYKEKMSEYIDETVFMAESFKELAERLKYIRNRLSWKRLFSVIVTDMNSIRINLYKRERIKDQSRYLRYEEAVGSTGQSQGIYIQFLIAIINYISNMNSSGNEGVEGKTIFIDNPFGAAKDIYIWEPIFKLLATNHVQLIVPARGATPAITGRFNVNYILGQKLVDSRQQTVVVDYYSSTKESELEYTRMDYEQATFDFL
ncbi:MAG: hypothetical protein KHY43_04110 [Lachnospira eligens]|nr:hypothetical protein [Lachnospira eligens]